MADKRTNLTTARKNIFLNDAMSEQLKELREKILVDSGLRVSEQDLIRSAIDVYIQACSQSVDFRKITTVGAIDRAILDRIKVGAD